MKMEMAAREVLAWSFYDLKNYKQSEILGTKLLDISQKIGDKTHEKLAFDSKF